MTMTETPAVVPPKKRRAVRRKRKAKAAVPPKPVAALAGLTATACAAGCNVNGCAVSGKPYCAHPFKGGLRAGDMQDEAAVARFGSAKKMLGKAKLNLEKL